MDDVARRPLLQSSYHGIRLWLLVGLGVFCLAVGAAALASGIGALALPDAMAALDKRLPVLFRTHMLAGGIGLVLLPLAFLSRRCAIAWHRAIGRAALAMLLAASFAGVASALTSIATPMAKAGFFVQGLVSIVLLVAAWRAVRNGKIGTHARLMQAVAAVMSGVIVLRLGIWAAVSLGLDFDVSYAVLAWGSWLVPLAGVIAWQSSGSDGSPLRWPRGRPISWQSGR
jgi:uncharacterized membrane protein